MGVAEMVAHTEGFPICLRIVLASNKKVPEPEPVKSGVAPLHLDSEGLDVTVYVSSLLMPALLLSSSQVGVAIEGSALSLPSCHLPDSLKH